MQLFERMWAFIFYDKQFLGSLSRFKNE